MSTWQRALSGVVLATLMGTAAAEEPGRTGGAAAAAAAALGDIDAPYDPVGRRDPFRPPRAATSLSSGTPRTPLQRYEIGQLKLVAIIYGGRDPRAVVEDAAGLGYIIRVGTQVGPHGGRVEKIERGKVRIHEESVGYYGETQATEVVMEMESGERGKR